MSGPTDGDDLDRDTLARSFDATASAYEVGRPDYPDDALGFWDDHGAFERDARVLDIGAGTGKLTRLLPIICRAQAVEPLAQMRRQFVAAVPDIAVRDGTAEHIPFDDDVAATSWMVDIVNEKRALAREAIERHLGIGVQHIEYPYRTVAFWCNRVQR